MTYHYKTKGTCSSQITFDYDGKIITNVKFHGGCDGNSKGISRLVDGLTPNEIALKCSGLTCGYKKTSCPDQLAHAVLEAKEKFKSTEQK